MVTPERYGMRTGMLLYHPRDRERALIRSSRGGNADDGSTGSQIIQCAGQLQLRPCRICWPKVENGYVCERLVIENKIAKIDQRVRETIEQSWLRRLNEKQGPHEIPACTSVAA